MSSQQSAVPHGSDRQRMLNVLAQRRYRQRKRERLQSLEKSLEARTGSTAVMSSSEKEVQLQHQIEPPRLESGSPGTPNVPVYNLLPDFMNGASNPSYMGPVTASGSAWYTTSEFSPSYAMNHSGTNTFLHYDNPTHSSTLVADSQLSAELQDLETSQYTFLPEHGIEIPSLKTMELTLRFAHMLGLADDLVNLDITRTLDLSRMSTPFEALPANLRPTEAQLSLPHFPVLDVLPWPSVRTKLIFLFSQPDHLRPPIARGPMAIVHLIHAFDDDSEGLRVTLDTDGHGYDEKCWEVGPAIFKDWWWILDHEIVSNSNRLRNGRGLSKLHL